MLILVSDASHVSPAPRPIAVLEDEITTLAAQLSAASYRLLELIAEFDRREGWGGIGIRSCAHWLTWKCGIDIVTAREKVRMARALESLPAIADAMRRGQLSYSKVRSMTRVATAANEHAMLAIALNGTATHVARVAQHYKRVARAAENAEAVKQHRDRELSWYWDEDGSFVIKGRLPADQGALIVKALAAADEALRRDEAGASKPASNASAEARRVEALPWSARQADALTLLAESAIARGVDAVAAGDRHIVNVHVNVEALAAEPARTAPAAHEPDLQCHIEEGPALAREVMRRYACDASIVALLENGQGQALDVGRKTRAIPPALRRALAHRDHGCRFPGCESTRFVDAHHVEHWADGGATRLDNLVLLCGTHHRLVHEGGFELELRDGEVVVRGPNGRVLTAAPRRREVKDGTAALVSASEERGVAIDARTGVPGWGGERADYDYLIGLLADRDAAHV